MPPSYQDAIGERVRKLRAKAEWSQLDLARRLGYKTKTQVVKIEKGEVPATLKHIEELAVAFDLKGGPLELLALPPAIWPTLGSDEDLQALISRLRAEAARAYLKEHDELLLDANFLEVLVNQVDASLWQLDEFRKQMQHIQAQLRVWIELARTGGDHVTDER
jgi:transcriptional regulator with XRE-family HTH domain